MLERQVGCVVVLCLAAAGCKKKSDDGEGAAAVANTATAETRDHMLVIHLTNVALGLTEVTVEGIDKKQIRTVRPDAKTNSNSTKLDLELDWSAIPQDAQELTVVVAERTSQTNTVTTKTKVKFDRPLTLTLTERSHGREGLACTGTGLRDSKGLNLGPFFPSIDPTGELVLGLAAPVEGKLEANGQTHDVQPGKPVLIKTNILTAALDKNIGDETPIPVVRAKLTAQGRSATAEVSCTMMLSKLFMASWDHVLLAPGESVGPAVAMVSDAGLVGQLGKAKTGRDYHLLARSFELPELEKPCGTYVNKATGETTTLTNRATRVEVRVKDRRTGQEVAKKEFSGTIPPCAKKVEGRTGDVGVPSKAAIDTWLASILSARSKT